MNNQRQNSSKALSILNSLLIYVFILFLIDKLNLSFFLKYGFIPVFLIIFSLKVFFLSGIGGGILEIVSGEEPVLRFRAIYQNTKIFWQDFGIVLGSILLIDFILFAIIPSFLLWRPVYFSVVETVAAVLLAQWMIMKKYVRPLGIPIRKINLNSNFLIIIVFAIFLEILLETASDHVHLSGFQSSSVVVFIVNYLHVFEFVFSSLFIMDNYPEINLKFNSQKEILLIHPMGAGVFQSLGAWFFRVYPPFFVVLKALSPKSYKFREFSRVIWHERFYKADALVCITCFTSNCYEAYKIAKEFKKRGSTVIMGGPHVTYLPQEALAFCDAVVIGAAEGVWEDVIRDYENGSLKSQYNAPAREADYAKVHEELLNSPSYIIKDFLETIRGCKFRCHFCTIPGISGGQVRPQPANSFVELIKKIRPRYSMAIFIDNNIYSDPGYAKELFTALKPYNIKWKSACTIDIAKNQETLKLAKASGCDELLIGYEVFGVSLEKNQGGKFAMAQKYLEYTKIIKKAGIGIKGGFIYGFDSDNLKTLFQLWKFCFSVMPRYTSLSVLTPLPGSGVYRDMLTQNRIINLNWRSYTATTKLVVRHPHLNPAVLSFFFPFIQFFFLITTSSFGLLFLLVLLFFPHYGMVSAFFR